MSERHDLYFAIGDANRRRILELLAQRERPVGELAEELGIAQPSVSQHLVVLRGVGLVEFSTKGRSAIYRLTPGPLDAVKEWIDGL